MVKGNNIFFDNYNSRNPILVNCEQLNYSYIYFSIKL